MTDPKSAQQQAEEARREAHEAIMYACGSCNSRPTSENDEPCMDCKPLHRTLDRAILLARLAQAEKACEMAGYAFDHGDLIEGLQDERDRLRREVEEVERGDK